MNCAALVGSALSMAMRDTCARMPELSPVAVVVTPIEMSSSSASSAAASPLRRSSPSSTGHMPLLNQVSSGISS